MIAKFKQQVQQKNQYVLLFKHHLAVCYENIRIVIIYYLNVKLIKSAMPRE